MMTMDRAMITAQRATVLTDLAVQTSFTMASGVNTMLFKTLKKKPKSFRNTVIDSRIQKRWKRICGKRVKASKVLIYSIHDEDQSAQSLRASEKTVIKMTLMIRRISRSHPNKSSSSMMKNHPKRELIKNGGIKVQMEKKSLIFTMTKKTTSPKKIDLVSAISKHLLHPFFPNKSKRAHLVKLQPLSCVQQKLGLWLFGTGKCNLTVSSLHRWLVEIGGRPQNWREILVSARMLDV